MKPCSCELATEESLGRVGREATEHLRRNLSVILVLRTSSSPILKTKY